MKYLKNFKESLSELQYTQRYTGGNRPALTAEVKAEIDKIHSGCTREDIEDVFREIYDEGIGFVNKVDFYYGMDKQGERFYGFSRMKIEIVIDDVTKKDEYFKIRETAFDRIRDMYGYSPSLYWNDFRELNTNLPEDTEIGDRIDFNSTKIYWITPRISENKLNEKLNHQEVEELLDYLDDIFYDLKEEGYELGYGGPLLSIAILRGSNKSMFRIGKFKLSEIAGTIRMMHNYITSTGLELKQILVEYKFGQKLVPIKLEDIDNIGEIRMLKMEYPEKI